MQNNVTELTDKLLRALDTNYNVTDMQAVIDIIVLLDKVAITKEVLEATRLGKHVNELRRNTSNEWLAKRAKELVKKWRNLVLPPMQQQQHALDHSTVNGQLKQQPQTHASSAPAAVRERQQPDGNSAQAHNQQDDGGGGGGSSKKRSAKEKLDINSSGVTSKRPRMNGGSEFDLSDTSNSSFHDAVQARHELRLAKTSAPAHQSVILVNSDSNSSLPEVNSQPTAQDSVPLQSPAAPSNTTTIIPPTANNQLTPPLAMPSSTTSPALPTTASPSNNTTIMPTSQQQRRRGRRKGSSAHRTLLDEADASFNSKMARGANARVKTTQELVASLSLGSGGGRGVGVVGSSGKVGLGAGGREDLVQKAAKLTERVVQIDQKLNTNANRYKNNGGSTTTHSIPATNKHHHRHNNNNTINSVSNSVATSEGDDEDVIVVDEDEVTTVVRQPEQRSRHRKRRDSAGNRIPEEKRDNVTIKHEEVEGGGRVEGGGKDGLPALAPPPRSLDTALALSLLPPIDHTTLHFPTHHYPSTPPFCTCRLIDNTTALPPTVIQTKPHKSSSNFSIGDTDDEDSNPTPALPPHAQSAAEPPESLPPPYEWSTDDDCLAAEHLQTKYRLCGGDADVGRMANVMHERYVPGVNCNVQQRNEQRPRVIVTGDSDSNVVPGVYGCLERKLEAYKPYSISERDGSDDDKDRTEDVGADMAEYREYHEVLDSPSYNGEILRILPYVIID